MAPGFPATPYNPYYDEPRRRFGTSGVEFLHITVACGVLTAVLWIVFEKNYANGYDKIKDLPMWARGAAAFSVSLFGFVLHELGHKFTAQHFGHWSEFRANWIFLGIAIAVAVLWGFPLAAPGATWHTARDPRDQGKIATMGPLVNYAVAFIALPFTFGRESVMRELAIIVVFFSSFLALFNLIPLGALDGRRVLKWNVGIWLAMIIVGVGLMIRSFELFASPTVR